MNSLARYAGVAGLVGTRFKRECVLRTSGFIVAIAAAVLAFPPPVHGQTFFEQLFGGFATKPVARPPQGAVQRLGVPEPSGRSGDITKTETDEPRDTRKSVSNRHGQSDTRRNGAQRQSICVRTCDGYFWPIRYPADRRDLVGDEAVCRASCGTEVKLYTRADPGVPAEEMRDESGRAYGESPTAFIYRKRLVDGCACRPMPWSESEVARHERYALIEAERQIRVAEAERSFNVATTAGTGAAVTQEGSTLIPDHSVADPGPVAAADVATDQIEQGGHVAAGVAVVAEEPSSGAVSLVTGAPVRGSNVSDSMVPESNIQESVVTAVTRGRSKLTASHSTVRRDPKPGTRPTVRPAVTAQGAPRAGQHSKRGAVHPGVFALAIGQPKFRYPGD